MDERFLRTEMLLGREGMARLNAAHVAVFGLGGVQPRHAFPAQEHFRA